MLSSPSFLHLPYPPDLTLASLAYAFRSIPSLNAIPSSELLPSLQSQAIQSAVELAFQRCLAERGVPFEKTLPAPFSQPEHIGFQLGGRPTVIHTRIIRSKSYLQRYSKDISFNFQASPSRYVSFLRTDPHRVAGLHVFALALAGFARSRREAGQAEMAGHPVFWLYLIPEKWRTPAFWKPLAPLTLKANLFNPLTLEIGGADQTHNYLVEKLELLPGQEVPLIDSFYSLYYLHPARLPDASLEISVTSAQKTIRISPDCWRNAWIYGHEIYFLGYLERPGWLAWQKRSSGKKVARPPHLAPIEDLFRRVVKWHGSVT